MSGALVVEFVHQLCGQPFEAPFARRIRERGRSVWEKRPASGFPAFRRRGWGRSHEIRCIEIVFAGIPDQGEEGIAA